MLLAASIEEGGRRVLILGLQRENIERLLNDQPIEKDLGAEGVPGLEEWTVYLLGPEDTARFVAQVPGAQLP
jgi:hypothetical protein